jgi:tetratricopeptide (TPR) repeat protein
MATIFINSCTGATLDLYHQGAKHIGEGDYNSAIASYKETIRLNPNHAMAHNNLASGYYFSGQHQDAIASYKEALRINPNLIIARNSLKGLFPRK